MIARVVSFVISIDFFFFFQAEDGIRDWSVTGVQTCALPISTSVVVVDTLAPTVQFKVGSVANTLPAGVTVVVAYSNNGGSTWTYVPASGACSAPASYDRCVNRVRWTFQNPFSATAPNNSATLQFTAQIR